MKIKDGKRLFKTKEEPHRIGVFGVGFDKYRGQFPGLYEKLMEKHDVLLKKLSTKGTTIINLGMADNPKKAYEAVKKLKAANLDLVFCIMLTYVTSGTFGIIIKTLVALLIMNRLEIGRNFAEFHPLDFNEGFVLVGHDGPHNISIAEGKPVLRSLKTYHGKPGSGAGVEFINKKGNCSFRHINCFF